MALKFKLSSVIFMMIFAIIITLSVFTLTRLNRDMMVTTVIIAVAILAAAAVITFLFARSVVKPVVLVTNTLNVLSEGEGGLVRRMTGNSKDGAGSLDGTIANIRSATQTLVKNNISVQGLIESYEAGLAGMQDVMTDLRGIVHSLDNALQRTESVDSSVMVVGRN